jgi:hypothetical protein
MALPDEFLRLYEALTDSEKQVVTTWFLLRRDFPQLFALPQHLDDTALDFRVGLLKFLADEIAHPG